VILLFYKSRIKIKTDDLNIIVQNIIKENPHPLVENKCLKIYFIKQISNFPPKFAIYTNLHSNKIKKNYKQFIMKLLSKKIFMGFIPIKIFFLKKLEVY
jgi:GTP-binding protein